MTTAKRLGVDLLSLPCGDPVEIAVPISSPCELRGLPMLDGFDVVSPGVRPEPATTRATRTIISLPPTPTSNPCYIECAIPPFPCW